MVAVKTGSWATAVWVGNGAKEGATGEMGVLNCSSNEVLVGEGRDRIVGVALGKLVGKPVGAREVGVAIKGGGVFVRGCRRKDPVIAIDVLVLLALCTSAALAAWPPETIQNRINKITKRPVITSACK